MSFPVLSISISGAKGLHKTPVFNSAVEPDEAGIGNFAIAYRPFPTWNFELDTPLTKSNEKTPSSVQAALFGTYMACAGRAGLFLFTDPEDNTVTTALSTMLNTTPGAASPMGQTGDGTSNTFQLARLIGGTGIDLLQNVSGVSVFVNGSSQALGTAYSLSSKGVVTFQAGHIPAAAAVLTWSGSFQYLCRFAKDSLQSLRQFTYGNGTDLWVTQSIQFESEFV